MDKELLIVNAAHMVLTLSTIWIVLSVINVVYYKFTIEGKSKLNLMRIYKRRIPKQKVFLPLCFQLVSALYLVSVHGIIK